MIVTQKSLWRFCPLTNLVHAYKCCTAHSHCTYLVVVGHEDVEEPEEWQPLEEGLHGQADKVNDLEHEEDEPGRPGVVSEPRRQRGRRVHGQHHRIGEIVAVASDGGLGGVAAHDVIGAIDFINGPCTRSGLLPFNLWRMQICPRSPMFRMGGK